MFATVRETLYDSDKPRPTPAQLNEFRALRERQPGYAGMVAVDAGNGRTIALVLWESEAAAAAAAAVLDAEVLRTIVPLGQSPGQIIAQGPILRTDLAKT
jgi:hypothetical protein